MGHKACQCSTSAKALDMHYSILNVDSGGAFLPQERRLWREQSGKSPGPRASCTDFEIGSVYAVKRVSSLIDRDRKSEFDSSPSDFGSCSPRAVVRSNVLQ